MTEKLKPCPCVFCGIKLSDAREIYGYESTHWRHPDGGCILEGLAVLERDLPQWNAAWNTRATGWRPIEEAPKDRPILAWCDHEAGVEYEESAPGEPITRSLYEAHGDGLGYAPTGFHIVEWGGGVDDSTHECPGGAYLPDWWFVAGSEFEVAANPTHFMLITPPDSEAPHD